jgi:hypothetical protein
VKLEVLPIPSGEDSRVTMSAEEQARVAQEIDANVRQSFTRGTGDLRDHLKDVVSHMVDRLNEPEARFHASLVSNVLDLVNLLPKLNVSDDQELNRFAGEIRNKLCGFIARDLKANDKLRGSDCPRCCGIALRDGRRASRAGAERRFGNGLIGRPHLLAHGSCFAMNSSATQS